MHGSLVNGAVQGLDGAAVNSVSANELKSVHSADDAISDLDSFIEAQNLEEMDFDAAGSDINKIVSNDSQRETHISDENGTSRLSLADDMNSISDASSYGKSLLGSDYSADELIKQDASTLDSASLMAATDMQTHTIPSNSIPMSIDKFGLYEGVDDSTINNVFGKAVQNLKTESSTEKKTLFLKCFSVHQAPLIRQSLEQALILRVRLIRHPKALNIDLDPTHMIRLVIIDMIVGKLGKVARVLLTEINLILHNRMAKVIKLS